MALWRNRLLAFHRFCVRHLIYALLLSSLLGCALYVARMLLSHERTFSFLTWNLFLAWIPFICSLIVTQLHERYPQRRWTLIVPGILWLVFLPNAPYIVTDIVHLTDKTHFPMWYDIGMFATFAWTGCILGIVSLNQMQRVVRQFSGRVVSWLFVFGAIWLSGFGIFLGRFHNLNSWDLFVQPDTLVDFVASKLHQPLADRNAIGVTLMFAAFMLVCYVTFVAIEHRRVEAMD